MTIFNRRRFLVTQEERIIRWWICFQIAGLILLVLKALKSLKEIGSAALLLFLYAALIWAAFAIL